MVWHWGTFICELCTVRSVIDRELNRPSDIDLLCLERMRIIDMANAWAGSTHQQYQSKLQAIRSFEHIHGFPILQSARLQRPPSTTDIPLMWMQESYSLRSSKRSPDNSTVTFATVRQLRSAASQFLGWEMMISAPLSTYIDQQQRVLSQPCRATDNYSFSLFTKGLAGRLGTETRPATALLFQHVRFMDRFFAANYTSASTSSGQRRWALAGLANALFWLGWLRSSETFSLTYSDIDIILPSDGPLHDLPLGMGMILCRLLPQTKANCTSTADVVLAFTTLSGISLGSWCHRVSLSTFGMPRWPSHPSPIFVDNDGSPWTSYSFRHLYICPF